MIIINKPYLDENEKKGKLICDILVNDSLEKIYLEVDKEYEKYLFRNILCYKEKLGIKEKVLISVLSISISIYFNNLGLLGYCPLIGTITYLWFMDIKDVVKFKYLIIFTMSTWSIYNFIIKSYTTMVFNIITIIIVIIISIIKIKRMIK